MCLHRAACTAQLTLEVLCGNWNPEHHDFRLERGQPQRRLRHLLTPRTPSYQTLTYPVASLPHLRVVKFQMLRISMLRLQRFLHRPFLQLMNVPFLHHGEKTTQTLRHHALFLPAMP